MTWITYKASDIGFNGQFGGSEGNFTYQPQWSLSEGQFKIDVVGDRVLAVEYDGLIYRHQNADGANIHGGNHTTSEWFTFDIGQFYYVNSFGEREQSLVSEVGFQGGHTITARDPLPAPCFGPNVLVIIEGPCGILADYTVENLLAGDKVLCADGELREILWTDGAEVAVTENNRPIKYKGNIFSPQHRVLIEGVWIKAKHLVEFGLAQYVEPMPEKQWYGHILLAEHHAIAVEGGFVESLLPTDRALSGMSRKMADEIRNVLRAHGVNPELNRTEAKRKDIAAMRAEGLL